MEGITSFPTHWDLNSHSMTPMKTLSFLFVSFLVTRIAAWGGLVVTDPTLIATNRSHQVRDLAEQLIRKANQEKQILRLVDQLSRMDEHLRRYGKPGITVADPEVRKLLDMLFAAAPSLSSHDLNQSIDGAEVFRHPHDKTGSSPLALIALDDGKTAKRNPDLYQEDAAANRSFEHYRRVRTEVLARRKKLRRSVASTTAQLQQARTTSEIRKLTAVLIGLQTELRAIDEEITFATAEMEARDLETEARCRLRAKARLEEDRARFREGARKDMKFYRLLTEPTYFRKKSR